MKRILTVVAVTPITPIALACWRLVKLAGHHPIAAVLLAVAVLLLLVGGRLLLRRVPVAALLRRVRYRKPLALSASGVYSMP